MGDDSGKKPWYLRVIRALIIAQIVYLVLMNLALQLPLTQTIINHFKPDKFQVSWDKAWTWYPFRIHASGVSANGQSRSQQWQLDTPSAAASINLLPLAFKHVWLSDIVVSDIDYKQRPRLKPDKDYSELLPFFPEIIGRDISPANTAARPKKRPWKLDIDGISAQGEHRYWIMQFKGSARGGFNAGMTFETRGGPFSLEDGDIDLTLNPLYLNGDQEVFRGGTVQGSLALTPFIPKENKGISLLRFLSLGATIDINVNSLAFINVFTRNFNQMTIDGSGQLSGQLRMDQGNILGGTDMAITADNILVDLLGHTIEGKGEIKLVASPADNPGMQMSVLYEDLEVVQAGDTAPLLTGAQLLLQLSGPGTLFPQEEEQSAGRNISFTVEELTAPNLALFEHYLPGKWPLQLYGGKGTLRGKSTVSTHTMDIDLRIASDRADLGIGEYRFASNLDAALKLSNASIADNNTSVAGSYITLTDAHLSQADSVDTEPWNASFTVTDGNFSVLREDHKQNKEGLKDLLQVLGESEGSELLANLHGFAAFQSNISSLEWVGVLLNNSYDTSVSGAGEISGIVQLAEGVPAPGTKVEISSTALSVSVLDYTSSGDGSISLNVEEGDTGPDWLLEIALENADLRRRQDAQAYINDVNLSIAALVEDVEKKKTNDTSALSFKIHSANISDMSIYSSYLPPDSPLQFTRGTAALSADILLLQDDADGWLKLVTNGLEMDIDQQSLRADLAAHIKLIGGKPSDMIFDISGSTLNLDNVRVSGENENFDQENWSAGLTLVEGVTTWKKPLELDAQFAINISDSRPIVAVFHNQAKKPDWLLEMLTIKDIEGKAQIAIANEQIIIPLAHAISDTVEVGAKGSISEQSRNGIVYARYKKLDAVIKITEGKKNVDIIRARKKYDTYSSPSLLQHAADEPR